MAELGDNLRRVNLVIAVFVRENIVANFTLPAGFVAVVKAVGLCRRKVNKIVTCCVYNLGLGNFVFILGGSVGIELFTAFTLTLPVLLCAVLCAGGVNPWNVEKVVPQGAQKFC